MQNNSLSRKVLRTLLLPLVFCLTLLCALAIGLAAHGSPALADDAAEPASAEQLRSPTPWVDLHVTKVWDDAGDREGLRPAEVTVYLYRIMPGLGDSTWEPAPVPPLVLSAANGWQGTFRHLPYGYWENPFEYKVVEDPVADYYIATSDYPPPVDPFGHTFTMETTLTNTLPPLEASAQIELGKILTGDGAPALSEGQFSFVLTPVDGAPMPLGNDGQPLSSLEATNAADGTISFPAIPYELPGTYVYEAREVAGDDPDVGYDPKVVTITVEVARSLDGPAKASVTTTSDPQDATFVNTYTKPETPVLLPRATKQTQLSAGASFDGSFTFAVSTDEAGTQVVSTGTSDGPNGDVTFSPIELPGEGTYTYYLREIADDPAVVGVAYDTSLWRLDVTVTRDADGFDVAQSYVDLATDDAHDQATFTNSYGGGEVSVHLAATKQVKGTAEGQKHARDGFSFEVVDEATGAVVARGTSDQGGSVSFDEITYAYETIPADGNGQGTPGEPLRPAVVSDDLGDHWYVVREVAGTEKGMTYDATTYRVRVSVTDDGDGTMTARVAEVLRVSADGTQAPISYPGELAFVNKFEPPTPPEEPPAPPEEPPTPPTPPEKPEEPIAPKPPTPDKPAVPKTGDATSSTLTAAVALAGGTAIAAGIGLALLRRHPSNR